MQATTPWRTDTRHGRRSTRRLLVGALSGLLAGSPAAGAGAELAVRDGQLTLELEQAQALSELLEAIGKEASIEVRTAGDLGEVEPQRLDGVPLADALKLLVGDHSLLQVFDGGRLQRVVVYAARPPGERRKTPERPRPPMSPAAGAPDPDDPLVEDIIELSEEGLQPAEIAAELGLLQQNVARILQQVKQQQQQ